MEKGIKNSWSLVAFARTKGKMKIAPFVNSDTGEAFKSCVFIDDDNNVSAIVNFSSKLGEMTAQKIVEFKDELQVVELNNGRFKLCKKGNNNWEDVDL